MRIARYFAALVALATTGLALGDFASDPNLAGAIALMVLIAVFAFLLSYLFRPTGQEKTRPAPTAEPEPEPEPRRKKRTPAVWSAGWDAEEAKAAKERRRR